MSFSADKFLERPAIIRLLLAILIAQLIVVWVRTPYLPAASSGDEVWFSEAGFFLLKEGRLRRPMLADDLGTAVRDMYPPMVGLGQALSFRLFGLNEFGMMALASMSFTVTVGAFYLL